MISKEALEKALELVEGQPPIQFKKISIQINEEMPTSQILIQVPNEACLNLLREELDTKND